MLSDTSAASWNKRSHFLIDIFADALKYIPDAKLLLVGAGELQSRISDKVKKLNLEESVIFTGNVTNPQEYYQAMDLFGFAFFV